MDLKSLNGSGCSAPCLPLPRCPVAMSTSSGYSGYPDVVSDPVRRKVSSSPLLEPTSGWWAWSFLHEHSGVLGCCRRVAFASSSALKRRGFVWCFGNQRRLEPCLETVSWVCKNAKPVALKMPEPLGSKYEGSVFTYPWLIPGRFFLPIFSNSFKCPNSPLSLA